MQVDNVVVDDIWLRCIGDPWILDDPAGLRVPPGFIRVTCGLK